MSSLTTNIHRVTNIGITNDYLPATGTHYTTVTVTTEDGTDFSLTLFGNDNKEPITLDL